MTKEEERERNLKVHQDRGDIVRGDDGFYVFWPTTHFGYMHAYQLRWIADELDRLNEPWEKEIKEYFDNLAPEESAESYEF